MLISIPDSALKQSNLSQKELLIEIAAYLYSKGILTIGQARKICGLDLVSFQKQLAKRQIAIHYDVPDLEKDIHNLAGLE